MERVWCSHGSLLVLLDWSTSVLWMVAHCLTVSSFSTPFQTATTSTSCDSSLQSSFSFSLFLFSITLQVPLLMWFHLMTSCQGWTCWRWLPASVMDGLLEALKSRLQLPLNLVSCASIQWVISAISHTVCPSMILSLILSWPLTYYYKCPLSLFYCSKHQCCSSIVIGHPPYSLAVPMWVALTSWLNPIVTPCAIVQ